MFESATDTAVSFRDIGISSTRPVKQILSNVSGYVTKGGITAVLGQSTSGKSMLMRALSGRVHDLSITGDFFIAGTKVDCHNISNSVGFVPQEDILVGDISVRQTLFNSAAMKRNKSIQDVNQDVNHMLDVLNLTDVADSPIGTFVLSGITRGQRKKVEIAVELIAAPSVLFLDEPTSGLDAFTAFEVLKSIRDIVRASNGKLSVIMSIPQPNSSLLELVDHIMVLGGGTMNFFGTVSESVEHLSSIGFPPPDNYTPTDYFLQVSDKSFAGHSNVNFAGSFTSSVLSEKLMATLDSIERGATRTVKKEPEEVVDPDAAQTEEELLEAEDHIVTDHARYVDASKGKSSVFRQYWVLLKREIDIAVRNPTLYILQFVMVLLAGFFVGAVFLQTKLNVDRSIANSSSGLLWIVYIMAYTQLFKVFHLSKASARFYHEKANNTCGVTAAFLAELTTTALGLILYIPGSAVAYFMMGFPNTTYPFALLIFWMTALTAESMVNVVSRLCPNALSSVIVSQGLMMILTVFSGGVFIEWNNTPKYWIWLQELSLFTQASRSAIINLNSNVQYRCLIAQNGNDICSILGRTFECDAESSNGTFCMVNGRTVLKLLQGTSYHDRPVIAFGFLVLIFLVLRLTVLILMHYPIDSILAAIRKWHSTGVEDQMIKIQIKNRYLEGQVAAMINHSGRDNGTTHYVYKEEQKSADISNYDNYKEEMFMEELNPQMGADFSNTEKPPHCLMWRDLSLTLKEGRTAVVDSMNGAARAGRVLAVMGPAESGKSSLLNALGNRSSFGTASGEISYGRREFMPADSYFVPQNDEVNDNFTVFEQIEFVGLQKCADRAAMRERQIIVMRGLGLHEKSKLLCSDLNNGDRKKVSIAMGMVCNPGVLFLDEPTTGLDSTAACSVVKNVQDLAATLNIAVMMTIHQPAAMVFDVLQDLYLLESGRLVYSGPLSYCEKYFQNLGLNCPVQTCVADFLLHAITTPPSDSMQWQDLYAESKFNENIDRDQRALNQSAPVAPPPSPAPSMFSSFYHTLSFFFRYYCRDQKYHMRRLLCLIGIAFFNGTLFLSLVPESQFIMRHSGALFFNIYTVLISVVAVSGLLARDRRQALEHIQNSVISPGMYCFSQLLVSIPFNFVSALVFQSIVHTLSNINDNGESFIYAVLLTAGHLHLMEAYMLCVIEVLKDAVLSATFSTIILGHLFLFSGFFITVSDMPAWIRWISYLTPTKYSYDGYLYQIFHSQDFRVSGNSDTFSGDKALELYFSQTSVQSWGMFGVLVAWVLLIRIVHYGLFVFQFPSLSLTGMMQCCICKPSAAKYAAGNNQRGAYGEEEEEEEEEEDGDDVPDQDDNDPDVMATEDQPVTDYVPEYESQMNTERLEPITE